MKKNSLLKRILATVLTAVIALSLLPTAALAWDNDDLTSTTWPYLVGWTGGSASPYGNVLSVRDAAGTLYSTTAMGGGVLDIMPILNVPSGGSTTFAPESFYTDRAGTRRQPSTFTALESLPADHSRPVKYYVRATDGRGYPMFIMAQEDRGGRQNTEDEKAAIIDYVLDPLLNMLQQYNIKMEALYQARKTGSLAVGDYHPVHANLLYYLGKKMLSFNFGSLLDDDTSVTLFTDFDCFDAAAPTELRSLLEQFARRGAIRYFSRDYYEALLETVAPFYLDYVEQNRIAKPVIDSYAVGSSKGIVDAASKTITIRFPAGTDLGRLPAPVIGTTGWLTVKLTAGSFENKKLLYTVTPYEESTGIKYDGVLDTYGFNKGADLSALWQVKVETGDPYNLVSSFAIKTEDGVTRYGKIDETAKTITLNLPVGTDLTSLSPVIDHTGTHTSMDAGNIDFTEPQTLTVSNSDYSLATDYTVTVTAQKSAECDILSYKIGDAVGTVTDANIAITIPYATDLSTTEPVIELAEFAALTAKPDTVAVGDNSYTVTAEDGTTRTYTVTVTRTAAATGSSILSFCYGSAGGTVDELSGTINMTLPAGTGSTFAPTIEVSPFATVAPASGTAQDFSKPVTYVVTAENGAQSTYTVTVSFSGTVAENEYKGDLQRVVGNIISRYRTEAEDDWEWMDLGFYQNSLANDSDEFSLADCIGGLDTSTNVAMTNIARKIMTMTARGFNCSNLAQYNGGAPYTDSKGNSVDDLAAVLYNYAGSYTINGPVFALIALDMGTYTIPENAVWTREALLEVLLNHKYLSDGFDTDMVAGIMYAIAPYRTDPVYGARVRSKLNEGLQIIINKMDASNYSFKAWGAVNSETASWVIMALCSMGIDCHVDPRFSDGAGHSALQYWMDNFANVSRGYFHHTSGVQNNAMATYQGCYAAQWYLNFLERGGQGSPYSLYYRRFDFSRQLSADASITAFEIEGKQGVITEGGEGGRNTIAITLPEGMSLANITPAITFAEGAALVAPTLPVTFVAGIEQPFTVLAEDGVTQKTYYVTVLLEDIGASGAEIDANSITIQNSVLNPRQILGRTLTENRELGTTDLLFTVTEGTDVTKLYLSASLSYGATVTPALDGKTLTDFSDWVTFVVTSEDGTNTHTYRIKVVAKAQAEITRFRVQAGGIWYDGVIDNDKNTVTVTGVDDSNLSSTRLVTDIDFTGKTCSPTSGAATDFASAATYTLSGDNDLASRSYTVSVLNKSGSPITASGSDTPITPAAGPQITGFSVLGVEAVIDQVLCTIEVTLPNGTDVTMVTPTVTVSSGCVVSPVSGEVVNLAVPVTYTVTLGTEVKYYTVSVVYERSISQQLWDEVTEDNTLTDHQVSRDPHGLPGGWDHR
ncbi:MAG: hypothetical protein GX832_07265 [Clostridiales bacterium]|nr:hypothetical protein [Clostridiales bacterium]